MKTQLLNFNKWHLGLAAFFLSTLAYGQVKKVLSVPAGRPAPEEFRPKALAKTQALVSLPFRDDFSAGKSWPDTALWQDAKVFVNQTLAQDPPSIGTATFDGIDAFGYAYDINFTGTDTADLLTSQPIDLSGTSGDVVLSFWYQPQGKTLVEPPENNDSLALYFYNPALDNWVSVWRTQGRQSLPFQYVALLVDPAFLQSGFQFRFISYGNLAGAYDVWHVDYIVLDDQRNLVDTILYDVDIAFTAPHPPLLSNYQAIPWFHYNDLPADGFKDAVSLSYIRNIAPGEISNPDLGAYLIRQTDGSGSTVLKQDPDGTVNIDVGHADNTHITFSVPLGTYADPSYTPTDEFTISTYQSWIGQSDSRFAQNDTVRFTQEFKNYYAYDDGSAERGYGVEGEAGALTLVKYDVLENSTLKGLYIYFVPAGTDATANEFSLVVYSNDAGEPGTLIYESDSMYIPQITSKNFYLPYVLDTAGIEVNGSVFIGVRQKTIARLNIGFDINQKLTALFIGKEGNLFEEFEVGSLMMRPFFNYLPKDISVEENNLPEVRFELYPNPTRDWFRLTIPEQSELKQYVYQIRSLNGQLLQRGQATARIDVSSLPEGLYLVQLLPPKNSSLRKPAIQKLMIAR